MMLCWHLNLRYSLMINHDSQAANIISPQKVLIIHIRLCLDQADWLGGIIGKLAVPGIGEGILMLFHEVKLCTEFFWQPQIVAIKKGNIPAFCLGNAGIACHGYTLILCQADIADSLIMKGFDNICNGLWRAIIYDQQFPI